jgi:hypothetical protein
MLTRVEFAALPKFSNFVKPKSMLFLWTDDTAVLGVRVA